jgi:hypothetical protein
VKRCLVILSSLATLTAGREPLPRCAYPEPPPPSDSLDNVVVAIDDTSTVVWIGTLKNFGRSTDGGETWSAYGYDEGLPGSASDVGTVRIAPEGDVYLGCFYPRGSGLDPLTGAGLARTRDGGNTWEHWTTADGLGNDAVWDTETDGEGTIWAGCWTGGVAISHDDGDTWRTSVPSDQTYGDNVFALARTDEYLFAGTGAGLAVSEDAGEGWSLQIPPGTSSRVVGFVEVQETEEGPWVWVGTVASGTGGWYGLWLVRWYDTYWGWTRIAAETTPGLSSNAIYWIETGAEDHLWMATAFNGPGQIGGLSHRLPNGTWETITGRGLYSNDIYSVSTVDNATVWAGTPVGLHVSRDGGESFEIIDFQPRSGFVDEPVAYAFPNPFSPLGHGVCTIRFSVSGHPLTHDAVVDIDIYDLEGRHVKSIVKGEVYQGGFEYQKDFWDGTDAAGRQVANGVYYYVIQANGERTFTGKIAVVE